MSTTRITHVLILHPLCVDELEGPDDWDLVPADTDELDEDDIDPEDPKNVKPHKEEEEEEEKEEKEEEKEPKRPPISKRLLDKKIDKQIDQIREISSETGTSLSGNENFYNYIADMNPSGRISRLEKSWREINNKNIKKKLYQCY